MENVDGPGPTIDDPKAAGRSGPVEQLVTADMSLSALLTLALDSGLRVTLCVYQSAEGRTAHCEVSRRRDGRGIAYWESAAYTDEHCGPGAECAAVRDALHSALQ